MGPRIKCTRSKLDTGQGVLGLVAPEDLVSLLSRPAAGLVCSCLLLTFPLWPGPRPGKALLGPLLEPNGVQARGARTRGNKSRQDKRRKDRADKTSGRTRQQTDKRTFPIHEGRVHFTRRQLTSRAFDARVHASILYIYIYLFIYIYICLICFICPTF